jgi:hypothetical protein
MADDDQAGAPAPAPEQPKTFTQDEVNRLIAAEKRRLQAEAPDLAELRAKAKRLDDIEAASKSELEKAQERIAAAEATAKTATDRAQAALRRAAVVAAAQRAGAVDPDAVLALIPQDAVTVSDDGSVTGVDEAVKALLDAKQYLVGKPPTPSPGGADGGPRGPQPGTISRDDLKTMTPEQIDAAYRKGELSHLV